MHILAPNQTIEKYPYSIGELRRDQPHTSFPRNPDDALLASWNVFPVQPTDYPQVDHTKNVTEGTPALQDGKWVQVWNITDATAEEIAERTEQQADSVRAERNAKLSASDWTQAKDIPENIATKWAAYRQQLRDVCIQPGFPWNVQWPSIDNVEPDPKLIGVEFEGVMCSATREDQNGLAAVMIGMQIQGALFQPTKFYFSNGNKLVLHLGNIQAFIATWMPFRQSFFIIDEK
jgi:hypothetical protein